MTEKKEQLWGAHLSEKPSDDFVAFCSGRDVIPLPAADKLVIPYDIFTNLAHVSGLEKINAITSDDAAQLKSGLLRIQALNEQGEFALDPLKEDVHTNIEYYLTNRLGIKAGGKLHTARSRNDQIVTDMRLYTREHATQYCYGLVGLTETLIRFADAHADAYMPGYTHGRPAMPTTLGHWVLSWVFGLLRDMRGILFTLRTYNLCPLGSAASFGSAWNPDREHTASLLGFDAPQENTLDAITNRGEFEMAVAGVVSAISVRFSSMAQDLIMFSHPYFDFIVIPDRFTSGSSIMPHKKNPDFAELIRGKSAIVSGIFGSLTGLQKGVGGGYNRDSQYSKHLIMDLFEACRAVPSVVSDVFKGCRVNRAVMLKRASGDFINTADFADLLTVKCRVGFREAYNITALAVKYSAGNTLTAEAVEKACVENKIRMTMDAEMLALIANPHSVVDKKTHTGAPSPDAVRRSTKKATESLVSLKEDLKRFHSHYSNALQHLVAP